MYYILLCNKSKLCTIKNTICRLELGSQDPRLFPKTPSNKDLDKQIERLSKRLRKKKTIHRNWFLNVFVFSCVFNFVQNLTLYQYSLCKPCLCLDIVYEHKACGSVPKQWDRSFSLWDRSHSNQ